MYRISDKNKNTKKVRWVLLEQLPTILSPKMLILVFLYAMAFTLLLLGLRILHFETSLSGTMTTLTSTADHANTSVLYRQESAETIQQGIASRVIRLHVIANSDTAEDQALKLKVRDSIIKNLQSSLSETASVRDARRQIIARIPKIQQKAQETVAGAGYGYPVKVTLGNQYFPVKDYGDLRFLPAIMKHSVSGSAPQPVTTGGASCSQACALSMRPTLLSLTTPRKSFRILFHRRNTSLLKYILPPATGSLTSFADCSAESQNTF